MSHTAFHPDVQRYRHGQTRSIVTPPPINDASANVYDIRVGDLIAKRPAAVAPGAGADPIPAENFGAIPGDYATLALAQEAFHDVFLGNASQRFLKPGNRPLGAPNGESGIRTNTRGVHEYDCEDADAFAQGDFVGPAANGGGTALESQKVAVVATANLAIGKVHKAKAANGGTLVLIEITGSVTESGPQAIA